MTPAVRPPRDRARSGALVTGGSGSGFAGARTGALPTVTTYDFRRPIQLSREHARTLQVGFEAFSRQCSTVFTSSLRTGCNLALVSLEQRSYAEYIDLLDPLTLMTIFSVEPMTGRGVLEIPLAAVMSSIDHILGGPGSAVQPIRQLSDIESAVFLGLTNRLLAEMRYALSSVVDFVPEISGTEYSPMFAQIATASDVVVVACFELTLNEDTHRVTVCLPFPSLLPHLVGTSGPAPVSERERVQRAQSAELLRRQFDAVPVEVTVRLRSTHLSPDALGDLAVGDVVRLGHPAAAPLEVTADDTVFAHATAGVKGDVLAALIVGAPQEDR